MSSSPLTPPLFQLVAYPGSPAAVAGEYEVWANAVCQENQAGSSSLLVRFKLEAKNADTFSKIIFPSVEKSPTRKHQLWKETCFECFIPVKNSTEYFEFNFSTNGNWNAYSFRNYREGMKEFDLSTGATPRARTLLKTERLLEFEFEIPLACFEKEFLSLSHSWKAFDSLGITLVLSTTTGTSYWAIAHSAEKPDFHVRRSFEYPLVIAEKQKELS